MNRRPRANVEDVPLVGRPVKAVLSTVSKPLQKVHDVVDRHVVRRGRQAIKFVGKPLTKGVRSLGKRSNNRRRAGKRSYKKSPRRR